jgi:phosphoribosyl 1,2-cyclic phosphodiesterase
MDGLDAAYIESNYDPHMLRVGPYPPHLQKRISGGKGHLSNFEAAELIKRSGRKLKWAALAHLSAENNEPYVALDTHRCLLGDRLALNVASRYEPGPLMEV